MKLGHFDYRVLGYVAAFTFGNPRDRAGNRRPRTARAVSGRLASELTGRAGPIGGRDAC